MRAILKQGSDAIGQWGHNATQELGNMAVLLADICPDFTHFSFFIWRRMAVNNGRV